jgi:hypothetical protein
MMYQDRMKLELYNYLDDPITLRYKLRDMLITETNDINKKEENELMKQAALSFISDLVKCKSSLNREIINALIDVKICYRIYLEDLGKGLIDLDFEKKWEKNILSNNLHFMVKDKHVIKNFKERCAELRKIDKI